MQQPVKVVVIDQLVGQKGPLITKEKSSMALTHQ